IATVLGNINVFSGGIGIGFGAEPDFALDINPGEVYINGTNAPAGTNNAPDVLTIVGGIGGFGSDVDGGDGADINLTAGTSGGNTGAGGPGSAGDIILTSGDGGDGGPTGGSSGNIELTPGTPGDSPTANYGNVILAKKWRDC
ncbi:unnamed protein product, partial [marine sediment metagenome]